MGLQESHEKEEARANFLSVELVDFDCAQEVLILRQSNPGGGNSGSYSELARKRLDFIAVTEAQGRPGRRYGDLGDGVQVQRPKRLPAVIPIDIRFDR